MHDGQEIPEVKYDERDIDKFEILKIIFRKLLEDRRIDEAEKGIFAKAREVFDISEKKCGELLKEAIQEGKESAGKSACHGASLGEDEREYKKSLYAEVLFKMLLNGKITRSENESLVSLALILEIEEDLEHECVLLAHSKIISLAGEYVSQKKIDAARRLLTAFRPEKKECSQYYKTAYLLFKAMLELKTLGPESAASEFESMFASRGEISGKTPWEALYYYARLIFAKDFAGKKDAIQKALEAAAEGEHRFLTLFELAALYHRAGKFDEAVKNYKLACEINNADPDSAVNIVSCFISQKKYAEAESFGMENYSRFSKDPRFLNNLGIATAKNGKAENARKFFREALEAAPEFSDARINLVSSLIADKRHGEAEAEVKSLEKISPNDPIVENLKKILRKNYNRQ